MKRVITYGTFDLFHEGHYNILKRAKALGDYLIVGVTSEIPTFLQVIPGSLHRVPSLTCWLLRIRVALVAGLNPTSHDTS